MKVVLAGNMRRAVAAAVTPQQHEPAARAVQGRAQQLAAQPPVYEVDSRIELFRRPGGRPVARVISYDADQEFGTYGVKRRRILGRAADIQP